MLHTRRARLVVTQRNSRFACLSGKCCSLAAVTNEKKVEVKRHSPDFTQLPLVTGPVHSFKPSQLPGKHTAWLPFPARRTIQTHNASLSYQVPTYSQVVVICGWVRSPELPSVKALCSTGVEWAFEIWPHSGRLPLADHTLPHSPQTKTKVWNNFFWPSYLSDIRRYLLCWYVMNGVEGMVCQWECVNMRLVLEALGRDLLL